MSLHELRGLPGARGAEAAGAGAAAGPGYDCDATIVRVVTGDVAPEVLDRLAAVLLRGRHGQAARDSQGRPDGRDQRDGEVGRDQRDAEAAAARRELAERAARQIVLAHAAGLMSGPAGLPAYLRTGLLFGPAASVSLPLDTGAATETIPAHLRRLVIARDRHCRFPGCSQPPTACQPHHILPRSRGGRPCLTNMLLLRTFPHLI